MLFVNSPSALSAPPLSALRETFSPQASYRFTDALDHDGQGNGPYRISLELTVDENEVVLDFSGSDDQAPGPINYLVNPAVPRAMLSDVLMLAGDPTLLLNAGAGKAVDKVILREGECTAAGLACATRTTRPYHDAFAQFMYGAGECCGRSESTAANCAPM